MARPFRLGSVPKEERQSVVRRKLLALSGGGYRGLFTARVLERMETECGGRLKDRFDLIAGTSIGGIVAIGLAAGVPAAKIREAIESAGPKIFRARRRSIGGYLAAQYDPKPLSDAVDKILGPLADAPFAQLPARLLVVAIQQRTAEPAIFRTAALAPAAADQATARDVALATSAAPTYFPPHTIGDIAYVDGGLIANAPDLVATIEAMRRLPADLGTLTVCSVGTAGSAPAGKAMGAPGKLGWIARHGLVPLTIDAQAMLATDQLEGLIPGRVLRIDARPNAPIALDDASARASQELKALADLAFDDALSTRGPMLRDFLVGKPSK